MALKLSWVVGTIRSLDCRGSGAFTPVSPTFHSCRFQKGFSLFPPTNQAKGGAGHRILNSKGTVHPWTFRVDTIFCPHCAQDSCPHPWTQGKHTPGSARVAPGCETVAELTMDSVWPCGRPPWRPGASSPSLPLTLSPWSCLSGIIWGLFFSGG